MVCYSITIGYLLRVYFSNAHDFCHRNDIQNNFLAYIREDNQISSINNSSHLPYPEIRETQNYGCAELIDESKNSPVN